MFILVTDSEATEYMSKAKKFNTTMFSSMKSSAITAIAEYLAQCDGKTLYLCMVGKEQNNDEK